MRVNQRFRHRHAVARQPPAAASTPRRFDARAEVERRRFHARKMPPPRRRHRPVFRQPCGVTVAAPATPVAADFTER